MENEDNTPRELAAMPAPKTPKQVAKELRYHLNASFGGVGQAGAKLGLSKQAMSYYLRGDDYLTAAAAKRFAEAFGFNEDFLARGDGDILDRRHWRRLPADVDTVGQQLTFLEQDYKDALQNLEETRQKLHAAQAHVKALRQRVRDLEGWFRVQGVSFAPWDEEAAAGFLLNQEAE